MFFCDFRVAVFCCTFFQKKKWIAGWVGDVWPIFFNLTRPLMMNVNVQISRVFLLFLMLFFFCLFYRSAIRAKTYPTWMWVFFYFVISPHPLLATSVIVPHLPSQHEKVIHLPNPYSAGIDFSRQNLTSKVDPRTERIKIFLMTVDPSHRYSNELERAN